MRLIDADALPKYTGYALSATEVAKAVESAPNVDAVEVVRCKDCKHRIPNPHGYTCKKIFKEVSLDDYCAWGERKYNEAKTD